MRSGATYAFAPYVAPAAVDQASTFRAHWASLFLLLSLPFLQFGMTYWISVQGLAFVVAVLFVMKGLNRLQLLLFSVIAIFMLLSLTGHIYSDTLFYAFIRIVRQLISMYLIVCAGATISWRPKHYFFDVVLPLVVVGLSGFVILQFATYTGFGLTTLFVPAQFFIEGYGTIADSWIAYGAARGFLTDVRASGTFSEPSYFGFIALSLAMLVVRGACSATRKGFLLSILFVALLCSKSASGVVLFALLVLFAIRSRLKILHWLAILIAAAISLVVADVLLNFPLLERLMNITDPVLEPSGYTRLVLPFKHIALMLQHKPLGVPLSEFFAFTSRNIEAYGSGGFGTPISLVRGVSDGIDNGFLNLILTFGIGGIAIMALMPFIIRDKLSLMFLFCVAQFNGDILSPDKAAVIVLVLSCRRVLTSASAPEVTKQTRLTPPGPFGSMLPMRA